MPSINLNLSTAVTAPLCVIYIGNYLYTLDGRASTLIPIRAGGVNSKAPLEFTPRTVAKTRISTRLDGEVKDGVLPA